ncbi:hypothetical protein FHR53_001424 [Xanthomonas arboricola]|uniref:hypothetical protein n=1 Tax=Xanthomonas TaxID=338 RepID=UPI0011C3E6EA|nr:MULTISPECIES: hypothetical protein [Xanthomonas]MBB3805505.1 hypothetical protein [Xanthomonas cannabis]
MLHVLSKALPSRSALRWSGMQRTVVPMSTADPAAAARQSRLCCANLAHLLAAGVLDAENPALRCISCDPFARRDDSVLGEASANACTVKVCVSQKLGAHCA